MIIETRSPELLFIQVEAERLYQVQMTPCIGAQTNDIAGVWGDFGLNQNNMEHGRIVARKPRGKSVTEVLFYEHNALN